MPGFRAATFIGTFTPRIPASYGGFASFENLTYPPRSVTLHAVGPDGPSDYEMAGYGDYVELPLALVREATLYATDDPVNGIFVVGWLFTSQRVRYGLRKDAWAGAAVYFGGTPGTWPGIADSFNRPDTAVPGRIGGFLGHLDTGQSWIDQNACRILGDRAAFGTFDDFGSPGKATAAAGLPVPCAVTIDLVDIGHFNNQPAGAPDGQFYLNIPLGTDWAVSLSLVEVDGGGIVTGLALLDYAGQSDLPPFGGGPVVASVAGTIGGPPVTGLRLGISPHLLTGAGLSLAAPAGVTWSQAGPINLAGNGGGSFTPLLLDNLAMRPT
jgi:hypothetical protein